MYRVSVSVIGIEIYSQLVQAESGLAAISQVERLSGSKAPWNGSLETIVKKFILFDSFVEYEARRCQT